MLHTRSTTANECQMCLEFWGFVFPLNQFWGPAPKTTGDASCPVASRWPTRNVAAAMLLLQQVADFCCFSFSFLRLLLLCRVRWTVPRGSRQGANVNFTLCFFQLFVALLPCCQKSQWRIMFMTIRSQKRPSKPHETIIIILTWRWGCVSFINKPLIIKAPNCNCGQTIRGYVSVFYFIFLCLIPGTKARSATHPPTNWTTQRPTPKETRDIL